jgi:serine/threonine-protein kinase HipA
VGALNVWMNGEWVGTWTTLRTQTPVFRYATQWAQSRRARALSLSLPLTADLEIRGPVVDHYFDNLLPDNPAIRRRIRERFNTRSTEAFDLLEAIGRDCVGAVQLLPPDEEPVGWNRVNASALSETELERLLNAVTMATSIGSREDLSGDEFRISIAGAQEKTALLSMRGRWFQPRGATPTTHILKLPMGIVGNFRGDFSDSVENEWLCGRILQHLGLPVAESSIVQFGSQKVLAVKRFDRRWAGPGAAGADRPGFKPSRGTWIVRLPQEDFCQATGRAPIERYEADGGPSMGTILDILAGSESPDADRATFILAQLTFWLLAATDGHGKNFSIYLRPGTAFRLTPLYDVLSAWPVIGRGANELSIQDAKLAMAVRGKSKHYRIREIQPRHWHAVAVRSGIRGLWERMIELSESISGVLDKVGTSLPPKFPARVIERISAGASQQAEGFLAGARRVRGA